MDLLTGIKRSATSNSDTSLQGTNKKPHLAHSNALIWEAITLTHLDIKTLYQYIRSEPDLNGRNPENYGLLYLAIKNENMEAIRLLLLQPSIRVNEPHGPHQELPLHCAVNLSLTDAVELLIEHGSVLDLEDLFGHTALTNSLFTKSLRCLELLMQAGASVTQQDHNGNTPLHFAITNQFPEALELLVSSPLVNVDHPNKRGLSPLALAISLGHNMLVRRLLELGANIDQRTRFATVLHHAVYWNRFDAVQDLVGRGCQVNVINLAEETPLLLAVQHRKTDIVRYLLRKGANPCYSDQDPTHTTNLPLLYAANHGFTDLCKILITDSTSTYFLKSAVDMSERAGHPITAQVLMAKYQERINKENKLESPIPVSDHEFSSLVYAFSDDDAHNFQ
ncbi:ankyrin repeat-containing domain protein [Phycomyces blakesleeanus]|uniref:Ankyrin repeat-containing domain protein n=1 Tax=Phycomyces blakesleeanus TaxID=4837 RepID=A0ABR3AH28_PHYBL